MAQVDAGPNFGAQLKDGFKPVNAWVSSGISWLDDIQQFYRERSVIEKEYASKLSGLAKKYFEKKAKKGSGLSVGEAPVVTPGSLESASMTTWSTQLNTLEQRAAEHDKFSQQLVANLADPLRMLASRYEELRKAHVDFAHKLEKERDSAYADLRKMKAKYDSSCQDVENKRKKSDGGGGFDAGRQKAQLQYQQQLGEMHNVKNTYIISINVTNEQKDMYYHEYVPELLNSMQDLNESRVHKLNSIWSLASQIESSTLKRSIDYMSHLSSEIPRNNPSLDSMMFATHNAGGGSELPNMAFEPSPVWHDDDALVVDETAQNFLRNVLLKSKGQLIELRRDVDGKKGELESARNVQRLVRQGQDPRDEVEVVRSIFTLQESLHESERQKVTAEVEISTITSVIGDVSIGARNHNFKSETFKIPTNCDHCGERIWGLSAKGFTCRDCGFTCHSKCEMKVPAECPGELSKDAKKKAKAERQATANMAAVTLNGNMAEGGSDGTTLSRSDTMNTLSSGYSASAQRSLTAGTLNATDDDGGRLNPPLPRRRMIPPPPATSSPDDMDLLRPGEKKGKMLYSYQKNAPGEISVDEGREVVILEPDDGFGWMKIRHRNVEGLVPTSYIDLIPSGSNRPPSEFSNSSVSLAGSIHGITPAKKKGPAVAPKRGAKKLQYVAAIYNYDARTEAEHSMMEGERFVLINKHAGEGWSEVEKGGVVKSVPANYIQEV